MSENRSTIKGRRCTSIIY